MPKFNPKILHQYVDVKPYEVAVETGTLFGDSTKILSNFFSKVYTIEINKDLYDKASLKFKSIKNITVILGDSKLVLPGLLKKINKPCVFYLDAHFSGDNNTDWENSSWKGYSCNTGYSGDLPTAENQVPLFEEIKMIYFKFKKKCIIYIDDIDKFDEQGLGLQNKSFQGENWTHLNLNSIKDCVGGRLCTGPNAFMRVGNQLIIQLEEKSISIRIMSIVKRFKQIINIILKIFLNNLLFFKSSR